MVACGLNVSFFLWDIDTMLILCIVAFVLINMVKTPYDGTHKIILPRYMAEYLDDLDSLTIKQLETLVDSVCDQL